MSDVVEKLEREKSLLVTTDYILSSVERIMDLKNREIISKELETELIDKLKIVHDKLKEVVVN